MGNAISELLNSALGIALSPIPIVGIFLILLGDSQEKLPSFLYIAGWSLGNLTVFLLAVASSSLAVEGTSEPHLLKKVLFFLLGTGLILLAVDQFKKRPKVGVKVKTPEILDKMGQLTAKKALLMGVAFATLNPINLLLTISAGASVGVMEIMLVNYLVLVILFVMLSSSSIIVPTIVYFRDPVKMKPRLLNAKTWLIQNNSVILSMMLLFIGVNILGKVFS